MLIQDSLKVFLNAFPIYSLKCCSENSFFLISALRVDRFLLLSKNFGVTLRGHFNHSAIHIFYEIYCNGLRVWFILWINLVILQKILLQKRLIKLWPKMLLTKYFKNYFISILDDLEWTIQKLKYLHQLPQILPHQPRHWLRLREPILSQLDHLLLLRPVRRSAKPRLRLLP